MNIIEALKANRIDAVIAPDGFRFEKGEMNPTGDFSAKYVFGRWKVPQVPEEVYLWKFQCGDETWYGGAKTIEEARKLNAWRTNVTVLRKFVEVINE